MTKLLFEFHNREAFKNSLKNGKNGEVKNQKFDYCVSREKGNEIISALELNIPVVIAFVKESTAKLISINENNELIENEIDFTGEKFFVRAGINHFNSLSFSTQVDNIIDNEHDARVTRWPEYIKYEFLKRMVVIFKGHVDEINIGKESVNYLKGYFQISIFL